ncbi:MAG: sodium:calcium antiporter [bacterium]|nr:sodium:calcium antiporter [bacterium]
MTPLYLILFIIAFFLMIRAGSLLVLSLTQISRYFDISEYMVAFVFMSFATSVPELSIGIASAFQGIPELSFGNILGANIINITLVAGLAAVMAGGLTMRSKLSRRNTLIIFLLSILPLVLAFDGVLSRTDGLIMLIAFALYMLQLIGDRVYFSKQINSLPVNGRTFSSSFKSLLGFIGGVLLLIVSAGIITYTGSTLALELGIANTAFGILFLSVSTALPEIVFGIRAKMLNHVDMAIGNILGSVAFNSVGITGLVAVIQPFTVLATQELITTVLFFVSGFVLFIAFIYTRNTIGRFEGATLILAYLLFVIFTSLTLWNY